MNDLRGVIEWFTRHCDGDWEHSYGIKIRTIDNPGWSVNIDTRETELEGKAFDRIRVDRSESNWLHYWASKHCFEVACGPNNLEEALRLFLRYASTGLPPQVM